MWLGFHQSGQGYEGVLAQVLPDSEFLAAGWPGCHRGHLGDGGQAFPASGQAVRSHDLEHLDAQGFPWGARACQGVQVHPVYGRVSSEECWDFHSPVLGWGGLVHQAVLECDLGRHLGGLEGCPGAQLGVRAVLRGGLGVRLLGLVFQDGRVFLVCGLDLLPCRDGPGCLCQVPESSLQEWTCQGVDPVRAACLAHRVCWGGHDPALVRKAGWAGVCRLLVDWRRWAFRVLGAPRYPAGFGGARAVHLPRRP